MKVHFLLTVFILSSTIFSTLPAEDWSQFQGPLSNGKSSETGLAKQWPKTGPKVIWSADVQAGFGGASVVGNEAFILDRIPGESDQLRCFDMKTGKEKWSYTHPVPGRLPYPGSRMVPTVTATHVFAVGPFGHVYCIDRKTHKPSWIVDLAKQYKATPNRFGYALSPVLYEKSVIVAPLSESVGVVALNKENGKELWKTETVGDSLSTPILRKFQGMNQILFLSSFDKGKGGGWFSSFDPDSGKVLWRFKKYINRAPIPCPIIIGENQLFITGGYTGGSVLLQVRKSISGFSFKETFRLPKTGSQVHTPILYQDHLYLFINENANLRMKDKRKEGGLACYDLEGNLKWKTGDNPNFGRGGMIFADGLLITQDGYNGTLRLIKPSPEKYKPISEFNVFNITDKKDHQLWAPPALSNGKLVVRSQDKLVCVDLK